MNSRKAARSVPATVSRLLKSNAFLKKPPPAFYPTLSYPPPPSLVRSLPSRSPEDLPRTLALSPYQAAKRRLDDGEKLSDEDRLLLATPEARITTRRKPPRAANSKNNRPLPIVFPEDEVRKAFFRDHPFEAYRPVYLAEGESVAEEPQPNGKAWVSLAQRSKIPSAEDAIAFVVNLHTAHEVPLPTAYSTASSQFRTLRGEHETALRAATLEARAHGAVFFGEIQRGILVEERVLDQWASAREIQEQIAAKRPGQATLAAGAVGVTPVDVADGLLAGAMGAPEFTGGEAYVERFQNRAELMAERDAAGLGDDVASVA
ncbi:hypothetical protein RQP46_004899 [Phenoliferia psychrophenolica]